MFVFLSPTLVNTDTFLSLPGNTPPSCQVLEAHLVSIRVKLPLNLGTQGMGEQRGEKRLPYMDREDRPFIPPRYPALEHTGPLREAGLTMAKGGQVGR